ncbi:MAG: Microsomal epoxide hydrolase [Gemmatimonadales bacterium]|jgi:pimeloyl-ACP methyl ester carboxylesterase|nr:Microsomal epoxide hydrolase [Gemmatimonadales bacterium]
MHQQRDTVQRLELRSGSASVDQFEISIPDDALADLRRRLESTRWSSEVANDDWSYGTSGRYLRSLVDYWLTGYDWRAQEVAINRYAHYRTTIDEVPIHFVHERGKGPDPVPIVLTHGWPWTFWDWHQLIGPLTDPAAHGLDPAVSFDVIVPSLPGFAFSRPLTRTGMTPWAIADLWDTLLRERLGYNQYAAAGGDWGSFITTELGSQHADTVLGIYLSLPPVNKTGGLQARTAADYAPEEAGWYERSTRKWQTTAVSHVSVQSDDPQTLAWALNDSPVGLAAWLLERRHHWCDGDFESVFSRDFLLTTVCLYWFTQSIGESMRIYADTWPGGLRLPESRATGVGTAARPDRVEVPTGIGVFPGELALLPRTVVEQVANVVFWSVHEAGGHFGPAEQPAAYTDDLRRFFGSLR